MPETPEKDLSIQNEFFNQARKSRARVAIFLSGGKRLVGRIKAFDRFTVILDAGGGTEEMIFKHAIATITTSTRPSAGERGGGDPRMRHDAAPRETASVGDPVAAPGTATPVAPPVPVPGGSVKT